MNHLKPLSAGSPVLPTQLALQLERPLPGVAQLSGLRIHTVAGQPLLGQIGGATLPVGAVVIPLAAVIAGIIFLKSCLKICPPNEVLILSGRKHRTADGQEVGYRVIFGGRVLAIPVLETVKRLSLVTIPVLVEVKNAYSKGGIPLHIQAIANIKVSSDREIVGNAIERFLDRDRSEIQRVARETLEGNLRGVVASLTPEQINEDRLQFAEQIAQDVARDLTKLGLHLDTLKIQSVADDVDYLRSIGRQRIAQVVRDAEIAEAEAVGQAERIEAECQQQAEVAKTQALSTVQQKQNELRKIKAELEQRARSEEERTTAAAAEARARAEQQMQTIRAELERLRLEADQVLPAEAERQAKVLQAQGAAAELAENTKATAQVNDLLAQVWRDVGPQAGEIFLTQQLEMVLKQAAAVPNKLQLQRVQVLDNGDGKALASLIGAYSEISNQFLTRVQQTLGIDVTRALKQATGSAAPGSSPAPPPLPLPLLPRNPGGQA